MKIALTENAIIPAKKYYGNKHAYKTYANSREVFESLISEESQSGIVLIDDSWRGSNYEVYDQFCEYENIYAAGEINHEIKKDASYSRFLLISKKPSVYKNNDKSSMIFVVSHKAGSLYRALAIFENYELNLTKIESRKVYGKPYEYMFYVDFEYGQQHITRMEEILAVYKENTEFLRVVGYYKSTIKHL